MGPGKGKIELTQAWDYFQGCRRDFRPAPSGAFDDRRDYGEDRYVVYGEARNEVITLVYTWRGSGRRIISARKATKGEREAYYSAIYSS
jgi:uncharacterized DUF497 family protein